MTESIVVALITGGLSLAGVVITCLATAKKTEKATAVAQAVTETKLEEQIKVINRRINDLELYHKS